MAFNEDRLSTVIMPQPDGTDYLLPDGIVGLPVQDYELGPVALNDTTNGINYQDWALSWDYNTGNFSVTPANTGTPIIVLNDTNVQQCSFCFDQNAHVNVSWTKSTGESYLYWFDTLAANWVTTLLDSTVVSTMLTMDDKRTTQTAANDILLFYTRLVTSQYNLYFRKQRDRFLTEYELATDVKPYVRRLGLHKELRVQIALRTLI